MTRDGRRRGFLASRTAPRAALLAGGAGILLPLLAFFGVTLSQLTNLPELDDYEQVLGFLNGLSAVHGMLPRLSYVAAYQHAEYKLVLTEALVLVDYLAQGHVDFAVLQAAGLFFLLPLIAALWLCFSPAETCVRQTLGARLLLFTPVVLWVASFRPNEILDWAQSTPQQLGILPFVLFSLLLLTRRGRRSLAGACLVFAGAVAASTNGFLLAPVGAALLLQQRRRTAAALWLGAGGALLLLYRFGYVAVPALSSPAGTPVWLRPLFALAFLGNAARYPALCVMFGLGLATLAGWLVRARWRLKDPVTFYAAAFVVLTALGVTWTRGDRGLAGAVTGRYSLYSELLVALLYLAVLRVEPERLVLSPSRRRGALLSFAAVSVLFCVVTDVTGARILGGRLRAVRGQYLVWCAHPEASLVPVVDPLMLTPIWTTYRTHAKQVFAESVHLGVFRPPAPASLRAR